MNNKILIILGMHRSGTSLVTQWLYKCGLQIGDQLAGPGKGNIEGHFEDLDFLHLHESILTNNNQPSTGFIRTAIEEIDRDSIVSIQSLLQFKNNLYQQWGWKEPRTCVFLKQYRNQLQDAKYLVLFRNFNDVVDSLIRRDFKNRENKFLKKSNFISRFVWKIYKRKRQLIALYKEKATPYLNVWIVYNEQLLQHIQSIKSDNFIAIHIENLVADSKEVFECIQQQWGFNLSHMDYRKVYKNDLFQSKADITAFIKDHTLLQHANRLTKELYTFHFKGNNCNTIVEH
jgi:hypothetical protein